MKIDRPLLPVLALTLLGLAGAPRAQDRTEPAKEAVDLTDVTPPELISIEFPGGTATEFVRMVRDAASQRWHRFVNLVVTGPAKDLYLPAIEIHDTEISNLFQALGQIAEPNYSISFDEMSGGGEGAPILMVRVQRNQVDQEEIGPERRLRVFPLRALTRSLPGESADIALSPETILTAVETALDLCQSSTMKPVIRFHQDSGLMFVQGTLDHVAIAEEIIDRLIQDTDLLRTREASLRTRGGSTSSVMAPTSPGAGPARSGPDGPSTAGPVGPGAGLSGPAKR